MKTTIELPLLPLRDVVVYPHMVIPLFVGREKSIEALEAAMTGDKQILLLAQKNPADDDPGEDALYRVGTIATVLQLLKLPDGTVKVLVEGEQRGAVERFMEVDGHLRAEVALIDEVEAPERESEVFVRNRADLEKLVEANPFPEEARERPSYLVVSFCGIWISNSTRYIYFDE